MAQASSAAAREPSMEEILASIRRIIEDSDGARKAADDPTDAILEDAPPADPRDFHYDDEAVHAETHAPEVEAFRSELAEPQPVPAVQPMEAVRRLNGAHAAANGFDHPRAGVEARDEPVRPEPVRAAMAQQPHEETQHRDDAGARGAIISEFASRQVAASFEELSEAFSASRKRSYDEIAEEIMRPMLQDWLDNNLPLLVERLVREEIERVARGGVR